MGNCTDFQTVKNKNMEESVSGDMETGIIIESKKQLAYDGRMRVNN